MDPVIVLDRLLADLDALAAVGATSDGNCRLALTDEDAGGRELVVGWMRELDMDVRIDRIGNVIATRAGKDPDAAPVMTGSHIDTVRTGGRLDGTLGVLAGLEVVRALTDAGHTTRRPLAVAFFTNEEGSRFAPDMLGSLVYAGGMELEHALEIVGFDGTVLGEELVRIGWAGTAGVPGPAPHAYVELHIEQGPELEGMNVPIGAVTGVQGISWQELSLAGQPNHAGTTPMHRRRDAGYVAARTIAYVREIVTDYGPPMVGTVGRVKVHPDLVNVVPSLATLTVDLRHTSDNLIDQAEAALRDFVADLGRREQVGVAWERLARYAPVHFDESIVARVEAAAAQRGLKAMRMPSGAGHDAQMIARMCPTGMVFVPSYRGISHNPRERTEPELLRAGATVLLDVLTGLADED